MVSFLVSVIIRDSEKAMEYPCIHTLSSSPASVRSFADTADLDLLLIPKPNRNMNGSYHGVFPGCQLVTNLVMKDDFSAANFIIFASDDLANRSASNQSASPDSILYELVSSSMRAQIADISRFDEMPDDLGTIPDETDDPLKLLKAAEAGSDDPEAGNDLFNTDDPYIATGTPSEKTLASCALLARCLEPIETIESSLGNPNRAFVSTYAEASRRLLDQKAAPLAELLMTLHPARREVLMAQLSVPQAATLSRLLRNAEKKAREKLQAEQAEAAQEDEPSDPNERKRIEKEQRIREEQAAREERAFWEQSTRDFPRFTPKVTADGVTFDYASPHAGEPRNEALTVSITSFPARIDDLALTLESVFAQTLTPDRIVLWLAQSQFPHLENDLPAYLLEYQQQGKLRIMWCEKDLRAFKRFYYAAKEFPDDVLVILDDDLLYDDFYLQLLWDEHLDWPNAICATRVHRIVFRDDGTIAPYAEWQHEYREFRDVPRMDLMATQGAGTLWPAHTSSDRVLDLAAFERLAPDADDLWLKVISTLEGIPTVFADPHYGLRLVDGMQEISSLWSRNRLSGGNDATLHALLNEFDAFHGANDLLTERIRRGTWEEKPNG